MENPIVPYQCPQVYACPACSSEFHEKIQVYSHMFQGHSWAQAAANQLRQPTAEKKVHACQECAQKYTTWNDFVEHLFCAHRKKLLEKTRIIAGERGTLDPALTDWIQTELRKNESLPVRPKEQPRIDIPLSPIVLFFRNFRPLPIITVGPGVACPDDVF
jgi:DNA-directed RNA polymerase subunit RPC12/RpoP